MKRLGWQILAALIYFAAGSVVLGGLFVLMTLQDHVDAWLGSHFAAWIGSLWGLL